MNDSVFGPFHDVRPMLRQAPWDLAGFTALNATENHLQSYAFQLRGIDPETMRALEPVLPRCEAFDRMLDVVLLQETLLARVAAKTMSVGAFWYAQEQDVVDPTLQCPFELLDAGFPFLKKSLVGKMAHMQDTDQVVDFLVRHRMFAGKDAP